MIKGIFHLVNDVRANAGDYLIMREDDVIVAVSRADLDKLFNPLPGDTPKKKRVYKTLENLERARARGRHMAAIRKQRIEDQRRARESLAAE